MMNWAILIIYDGLKSSMHCTLKSRSASMRVMALIINIKERSSTVLSISTQVQTHAYKGRNTIHNQNPKCSSHIVIMFNVVVCNYLDVSNYQDHMITN